MSYSQFTTLKKAIDAFDLEVIEAQFFPEIPPIEPSSKLLGYLEDTLPIAAAGSEKARSEGIIYPVLVEVRRQLSNQVSLFSGEDFSVDESVGLNGIVDFLLSHSPRVLEIQVPVVVLVEAKKADLKTGYGQCVAEMVAAQRFNEAGGQSIPKVYGAISSGTQWRFLQLEGTIVTIDLMDYPLPPVDRVLANLVWMAR